MVRMTEKIQTIEELAKLSGSLMKTTARVGAPTKTPAWQRPDHGWPRSILSIYHNRRRWV
jgi:hypothetical protein